jgi:hypothetical protein
MHAFKFMALLIFYSRSNSMQNSRLIPDKSVPFFFPCDGLDVELVKFLNWDHFLGSILDV